MSKTHRWGHLSLTYIHQLRKSFGMSLKVSKNEKSIQHKFDLSNKLLRLDCTYDMLSVLQESRKEQKKGRKIRTK